MKLSHAVLAGAAACGLLYALKQRPRARRHRYVFAGRRARQAWTGGGDVL